METGIWLFVKMFQNDIYHNLQEKSTQVQSNLDTWIMMLTAVICKQIHFFPCNVKDKVCLNILLLYRVSGMNWLDQ